MLKMKLICRSGRTKDTLGHRQEVLQFLGMDVALMGAIHMGVLARKTASTTVMEMMTGPMALVVER